jgi:hypothetical protein
MRIVDESAVAAAVEASEFGSVTRDATVPAVEGLSPAPRKSAVIALQPDRLVPNTAMVRIFLKFPLTIVAGC